MKRRNILLLGFLLVFSSHNFYLRAEKKIIQNGVQVEINDLNIKVQFYADNIVRVVKWLPGTTPDTTSLVVIRKTMPEINIRTREIGTGNHRRF